MGLGDLSLLERFAISCYSRSKAHIGFHLALIHVLSCFGMWAMFSKEVAKIATRILEVHNVDCHCSSPANIPIGPAVDR